MARKKPPKELHEMVNSGMSMREMGRILGVHHGTIGSWLDRAGIDRPVKGGAQRASCKAFPSGLVSMLDGLVLSDASITRSASDTYSLHATMKSGLTVWSIARRLRASGLECSVSRPRGYYRFRSQSITGLRQHYERWYRNGRKIVPADISNDGEMWRYAHVGDGSISRVSTWGYVAMLHTCSFTIEENAMLVDMLARHGVEARVRRSKGYPLLYIGSRDVRRYIGIMGDPPASDMAYKFRLDEPPQRFCRRCSKEFTPRRSDMVFCSRRCAIRHNHPFYRSREAA